MSAGIIESISFRRIRGSCEHGDDHSRYEIKHATGWGHTHWCPHPLCDQTPLLLSTSPGYLLLTSWVGDPSVAVAYLLVLYPPGRIPHVEARIGIIDQWQDRRAGNLGVDGERRLFSQRYFAESGPGVYPATIVDPPSQTTASTVLSSMTNTRGTR